MLIKLKRLRKTAMIPEKRTLGAANYDLFAAERDTLYPGQTKIFPIGWAVEFEPTHKLVIKPRSGLASRGITVEGGEIDSDYRGEIGVILRNTSDKPLIINAGMSIAQCCLEQVFPITFWEVEELSETDRGSGGFGSTGD